MRQSRGVDRALQALNSKEDKMGDLDVWVQLFERARGIQLAALKRRLQKMHRTQGLPKAVSTKEVSKNRQEELKIAANQMAKPELLNAEG